MNVLGKENKDLAGWCIILVCEYWEGLVRLGKAFTTYSTTSSTVVGA